MIQTTNSLSAEVLAEDAAFGVEGLGPFRYSYFPRLRGDKLGPAKAGLLPAFRARRGPEIRQGRDWERSK